MKFHGLSQEVELAWLLRNLLKLQKKGEKCDAMNEFEKLMNEYEVGELSAKSEIQYFALEVEEQWGNIVSSWFNHFKTTQN